MATQVFLEVCAVIHEKNLVIELKIYALQHRLSCSTWLHYTTHSRWGVSVTFSSGCTLYAVSNATRPKYVYQRIGGEVEVERTQNPKRKLDSNGKQ